MTRRDKLRLTSCSGNPSEVTFANGVRGGNEKRVKALLRANWPNIEPLLLAKLSFVLTLDRDTSLDDAATDVGDAGVPDVDKVTMTVTAFQLGIIAKRPGVIRAFLQKILDIPDEDERFQLLKKVLETKTFLDFPKDPKLYDKDDRSLDGMNAFHLGAKYSPGALNQIFYHLNDNNFMEEDEIKSLLEATDDQIRQTPLHIAAAHPAGGGYSWAARYIILYHYDRLTYRARFFNLGSII